MMCYRDMTFCSETNCGNLKCNRNFTEYHQLRALQWWNISRHRDEWEKPPVAISDFKDTEYCIGFKETE